MGNETALFSDCRLQVTCSTPLPPTSPARPPPPPPPPCRPRMTTQLAWFDYDKVQRCEDSISVKLRYIRKKIITIITMMKKENSNNINAGNSNNRRGGGGRRRRSRRETTTTTTTTTITTTTTTTTMEMTMIKITKVLLLLVLNSYYSYQCEMAWQAVPTLQLASRTPRTRADLLITALTA